jgi:hypothetical protein
MCTCAAQMDEKLKPLGHALVTTLFGEPKVCIETYRERKGAKRAPKVLASFCPFCGEKYGEHLRRSGMTEAQPDA